MNYIDFLMDALGRIVFPMTHERAVVDDNGTSLETKMQLMNESISSLAENVVVQTSDRVSINPNVLNVWSQDMARLEISFLSGAQNVLNEYMIQFQCPSDSVTVLTLPSSVKWVNDEPIDLQEGWVYQISIIDNLAVYAGWEAATV